MKPMFFFGSLRDRELLEVVLDRAVADPDLSNGWVVDHAALQMQGEPYPWLAKVAGARAEGLVISWLTASDIRRLEYFEEAEYGLADISVETASGTIEAVHFATTGKLPGKDQPWDYERWQRESRAIAIEEARELMAHIDITPVAQMDDIWPGIKIRAVMRARAKAETPVTGRLRPARSPGDVQSLGVDRPYTKYFAMEEHRLRHRTFDGGWSPEIMRAVFTSGDAVTVIPYDADRDEVLLIEQFRAPIFARGDACPWAIEAIAGRIDKEQSAEDAARREAQEEAGLSLGEMEIASAYYPTPGFAAEHLTSFIAQANLSGSGGVFGVESENEDIRAFTVSFDEAMQGVDSGEINVGPCVLSLLWLARNRDRLRARWVTQG